MGRPQTPKSKAPAKAIRAPIKAVVVTKVKTRPLPAVGDIKTLAKFYREYSKVTLGKRLIKMTRDDRRLFTKLSQLSVRQVQRLAATDTPKKAPHPKKTVTAARIQWASLVKEGGHLATLKALQEELEELIEQKIALSTLREWITDIKKPKAPPYYRADNDATYFWKRLASQQQ
jgi:transposase